MRITHLSTTDQSGGAARAAYRLHRGLLEAGCDSKMLVQRKVSSDPCVLTFAPPGDPASRLRRAILGRYLSRKRRALEALPQGASLVSEDRSEQGADVLRQLPGQDVLHLHWCSGFFDYRMFFRQVPPDLPLLWTLHDMFAFTGGCHFDDGCGKYAAACGACPQLHSVRADDFSADSLRRKKSAMEALAPERLHLVAPSRWMAGEAQKSRVLRKFPVSVIPYGLDMQVFQPHDRQKARREFGIPADARVILFVADSMEEKRKGLHKLLEALEGLEEQIGTRLVSLGRGVEASGLRIAVQNLGYVREDEKLALAYSAADVFVAPSLQDNFPNTVLEAFSCGVPVIAFAAGGCAEQVEQGRTGLLVPVGDALGLRESIVALLGNAESRAGMSRACRQEALEKYALRVQAARYQSLYESLLQGRRD
jgi:glycosyltransferase involved in cell wall biosynthesis